MVPSGPWSLQELSGEGKEELPRLSEGGQNSKFLVGDVVSLAGGVQPKSVSKKVSPQMCPSAQRLFQPPSSSPLPCSAFFSLWEGAHLYVTASTGSQNTVEESLGPHPGSLATDLVQVTAQA